MFIAFIYVSGFLRLCKGCYAYALALISLFIIVQSQIGLYVINRRVDLELITATETNSRSSVSMVDQYRPRTLNASWDYFHSTECDIYNSTGDSLFSRHPVLNTVTLLLESHSVMYCAVPKVATKAVLTAMIYTHLRDISEHLNNNWTNIDIATARTEQLINISVYIEELRKNAIKIPKEEEPKSLAEFLRTYLHILRFGNINTASSSPPPNPWRLNIRSAFPYLHLKSFSNLSKIFSPSFTRVIFVRHPFERLASAYKEKVTTLTKDRIQAEPGYDALRALICSQKPRVKRVRHSLPRNDACKDNIPSFELFIKFILGYAEIPAYMDIHWQPYSVLCQVCKFKYNFIGKYETFNEDFTYFLKGLNLSDWNIEKRHGPSGHTTRYYKELYSTLPDEVICQLIRLYDDDFRLFNYRVDSYINRTSLIQSCKPSRSLKSVAGRPRQFVSKQPDAVDQRSRPIRSGPLV